MAVIVFITGVVDIKEYLWAFGRVVGAFALGGALGAVLARACPGVGTWMPPGGGWAGTGGLWVHNLTVAALVAAVAVLLTQSATRRLSVTWPVLWAFGQGLALTASLVSLVSGHPRAWRLAFWGVLPHGGLELGALLWAAAVTLALMERKQHQPGLRWPNLLRAGLSLWVWVLPVLGAAAWVEANVTPRLIALALH